MIPITFLSKERLVIEMTKRHVEALLFVSKTPLTLDDISSKIEKDEDVVLRWIRELIDDYKDRGVLIRQVAGGFEMVSAFDVADVVEKVIEKKYEKISRSTRETITIVALHQPVERAFIGKLREVKNPDGGIEKAIELNLIKQTSEGYITTDEFLRKNGVNDLEELKEKLKAIEAKHTPLVDTSDIEEKEEE
jgi:segregation and condensation protein B